VAAPLPRRRIGTRGGRSLLWVFIGANAIASVLWGLVALDAAGTFLLRVSPVLLLFVGGLAPTASPVVSDTRGV